jgi:hypothetical protein
MDFDDFSHLQAGTGKNVAIGAASVQSAAVGAQTYAIRVVATGACHIETGPNPTATATSALIAANAHGEYFKVSPGDKVAVIQDGTATGNLNIVEMSK